MRTLVMATGFTTVTGILLIGAAAWGLVPTLAVPVAIVLVLLLALLVLRRSPVALTGLTAAALVSASVRDQTQGHLAQVVVTAGLLTLLLLASLPLTGGTAIPARTVAALAATGALVAWMVHTLGATATATGALSYVVGLASLAVAYWLAVPSRVPPERGRGEE